MHASPIVPLLHRWLRRACPAVHAARATAVVTVVEAVVLGATLALTHLGRNLRSAAFERSPSTRRFTRSAGTTARGPTGASSSTCTPCSLPPAPPSSSPTPAS